MRRPVRTLVVTLLACALALVPTAVVALGTGHITGTVTGPDGAPLAGAVVRVYVYGGSGTWLPLRNVAVGDDGTYDVTDLDPDVYRLSFGHPSGDYASEWWNDSASFGGASEIDVPDGGTVGGVDARLAPASRIRGRVVNLAGDPVASVLVGAVAYDPDQEQWDAEATFDDRTGTDGTYQLDRMPAGTYRVVFQAPAPLLSEVWDDVLTFDDGTDVALGAGQVREGIDATLAEAAGIRGTVTSAAGSPLAGMAVDAYRRNQATGAWQLAASTSTRNDGTYVLGALRDGTYRIGFSDIAGTWVPQFFPGSPDLASAGDVVVAPGGVRSGVDVRLSPASPLVSTTPPTITGQLVVGGTLTADPGGWNVAPDRVDYAWFRNGRLIEHTDRSLVLGRADVGVRFAVLVTASRSGWLPAQARSAETGPVAAPPVAPPPPGEDFRNTGRPVVKGRPVLGRTLRATAGTWSHPPSSLTFTWLADGKFVRKGTARRLLLTRRFLGKRISVKVYAEHATLGVSTVVSARTKRVRRP